MKCCLGVLIRLIIWEFLFWLGRWVVGILVISFRVWLLNILILFGL